MLSHDLVGACSILRHFCAQSLLISPCSKKRITVYKMSVDKNRVPKIIRK